MRFAIAPTAIGMILVSMAREEFEAALTTVLNDPLSAAALQHVAEFTRASRERRWSGSAGRLGSSPAHTLADERTRCAGEVQS